MNLLKSPPRSLLLRQKLRKKPFLLRNLLKNPLPKQRLFPRKNPLQSLSTAKRLFPLKRPNLPAKPNRLKRPSPL